jgi:tRNA(Ile)-lysidine synthetase-like protein
VVVAVSGGPDSLALLHALHTLRRQLRVDLHVAHLDHGLRGAEAQADAQFVAECAEAWGLPCTVEAVDVAALARAWQMNQYAAGRAARYALLARVAHMIGAQAVAVAHTADDQAETVLMHLLRGAGTDGLAGMRPQVAWPIWRAALGPLAPPEEADAQPRLIRPLLAITRAAVEAHCATHGLAARRDPSNADTTHTRSSVRHTLLPQLIEYNRNIVASLCRTAEVLAEEQDLVAALLGQSWPALADVSEGAVSFSLAAWRAVHPAVQSAALRRAYLIVGGDDTLGRDDIERARAVVGRGRGKLVELPGGVQLTTTRGGFVVAPLRRGGDGAHEDARASGQ